MAGQAITLTGFDHQAGRRDVVRDVQRGYAEAVAARYVLPLEKLSYSCDYNSMTYTSPAGRTSVYVDIHCYLTSDLYTTAHDKVRCIYPGYYLPIHIARNRGV